MNENGLGPDDIAKAVKYGTDLLVLELKYESVKEQLKLTEDKKQNLISEQENLQTNISIMVFYQLVS